MPETPSGLSTSVICRPLLKHISYFFSILFWLRLITVIYKVCVNIVDILLSIFDK